MNNDFTLLPLDEDMLDECVDLFIDTFTKEPWNDVYESREQVVTFFQNYMNDSYFLGYVMKSQGKIIALSIGAKKPWIKGMEYYIDQFCVSNKCQRSGIGSKFLGLIEADVEKKGLNSIYLTTERGFPAEAFYLKNGFKRLDELVFLGK